MIMATAKPASTVHVTATQRFSASAERVFDAFLDPKKIGQWMFGKALRDEEVLRIHVDARVGGTFSFLVKRGDQMIDHVGTYLELERPRRSVFTWGIKGESENEFSQVTIHIVPQDQGCELTLTHEIDAQWAPYADRTRDSWSKMLGVLAGMFSE
jgi:uncharacterized protein YndB with AHSA1/START domain